MNGELVIGISREPNRFSDAQVSHPIPPRESTWGRSKVLNTLLQNILHIESLFFCEVELGLGRLGAFFLGG